ncbi:MAG TPA: hypothetical protein VLA49_08880 [Anaerolineales bacterium]|nr:hypothetical protein [Anaerolineales bacterium]
MAIAIIFTLLVSLIPMATSAGGGVVTGTFNFCWGWITGYGGDTFTSNGYYVYYPDKNAVTFKCMGKIHGYVTPPADTVQFPGDRPYYYWETSALDWLFGYYDWRFGPSTGSTSDVRITVYPDGKWVLIARANLN